MQVDMVGSVAVDILPILASATIFAMIKPASVRWVERAGWGRDVKEQHALGDRATGFVHAIFSSILAVYFLSIPTFALTQDGSLCTPMENGFKRLAQFSAGYFLYDIVMSLGGWGWAYILHAVFSFTAFAIPVFTPYAHRYACGFLCFEMSTIPFHGSYFVKGYLASRPGETRTAEDKEHPVVLLLQYTFAASFIAVRIFFGYWFSAKFQSQVWNEPQPDCIPLSIHYTVTAMNMIFNGLNTFWAHKIIVRALSGSKKRASKMD